MDKKRKKVLIFSVSILIIGLVFMVSLILKKEPIQEPIPKEGTEVSTENPSNETENNTDTETPEDSQDEEKGLSSFATLNEKNKYFMDGKREKAEIKEKDYTYLLTEKPIDFQVKIPPEWANQKTQVDDIPGFYEKEPSERAVYYKEITTFNKDEKKEIEKIKNLNSEMYEAYQKRDYNTYLKNMYKSWREYYGVYIGKIIGNGEYKEKILGFYPEKVDLKIGYAYGFMIKEISYIYQGSVKERRVADVYIMYKQNDKGDWEVYYEHFME